MKVICFWGSSDERSKIRRKSYDTGNEAVDLIWCCPVVIVGCGASRRFIHCISHISGCIRLPTYHWTHINFATHFWHTIFHCFQRLHLPDFPWVRGRINNKLHRIIIFVYKASIVEWIDSFPTLHERGEQSECPSFDCPSSGISTNDD